MSSVTSKSSMRSAYRATIGVRRGFKSFRYTVFTVFHEYTFYDNIYFYTVYGLLILRCIRMIISIEWIQNDSKHYLQH